MKKIFSIIALFSLLLFMGCKKGETSGDFAANGIGSYVTKVALGNGIIDYANLASSKVDVTVREYGSPVASIKVLVSKGAATTNSATWKLIKEVPYNGDTKLEVTANEIATALGIPVTGLETGATYTLYNRVVSKDGQEHDITNMNSSMYGNPNYNALMTWNAVVVCPFNPAAWGGVGANFSARVLEDGWADYSPGDIINNIIITSATQLRFDNMWLTNPTRPVLVNITAATGAATVAKQDYGDYPSYGIYNLNCQSSGTNNWVFSCVNLITLTLTHTSGSSNYGTYLLRLQKI
jgi:hypothetical protein